MPTTVKLIVVGICDDNHNKIPT